MQMKTGPVVCAAHAHVLSFHRALSGEDRQQYSSWLKALSEKTHHE